MSTMKSLTVIFYLVNLTLAQHTFSGHEFEEYPKFTEDLELSNPRRARREVVEIVNETPVKAGSATGRVVAGVTRLASNLPQFRKDGRHYWPTELSLTSQIGLQGINELVDDVASYERTRALAIARAASCAQRRNCWWNQSLGALRKVFGPISEDQELAQKLDCNKVFNGCELYH